MTRRLTQDSVCLVMAFETIKDMTRALASFFLLLFMIMCKKWIILRAPGELERQGILSGLDSSRVMTDIIIKALLFLCKTILKKKKRIGYTLDAAELVRRCRN